MPTVRIECPLRDPPKYTPAKCRAKSTNCRINMQQAAGGVILLPIAVAIGFRYVSGMNEEISGCVEADLRAVVDKYVESMNKGDISGIRKLSTDIAIDQLAPGFIAGPFEAQHDKIMARIPCSGPLHVVRFSMLARGDQVCVAEVYMRYEDQTLENLYYYPHCNVRFNFRKTGDGWRVMSLDRFNPSDETIPGE